MHIHNVLTKKVLFYKPFSLKLLDKGFRKEFYDVPGHLVDQLYKLYKRRPRYYFREVVPSIKHMHKTWVCPVLNHFEKSKKIIVWQGSEDENSDWKQPV